MTNDLVDDSEELYRNVRGDPEKDEYYYENGRVIITSQAFLDRDREPSVDRSKLRNFDPSQSRIQEGNGIVSLISNQVRQIGNVESSTEGKTRVRHAVDIKADPIEDNMAHAKIVVTPEFFGSSENKKNKVFKLLRVSLARLATERGWTLPPEYH